MSPHAQNLVLSERQLAILEALVEEYVATAQPVSSGAIVERLALHASSATIRNEMAHLEEHGLLLQPHTSAGRIPTDLGYRVFVDHLLTNYRRLREQPEPMTRPADPGVAATCRLLGELTRYTALALVPEWQQYRLRHIELAPVGQDQLLVVLVTDNQQVLHSLSAIKERPALARLHQLNNLLNDEFGGHFLYELTPEALTAAVAKLPHVPDEFARQAPELVHRGLVQDPTAPRMHVEGTTHIFEQHEFASMPKLRALMDALQEASVFETLFTQSQPGELRVSIGAENPHAGLEDCAIVFTSYQITPNTTGRIGVLGPKRMKYRQVIRAVDVVVHSLNERLTPSS
jgi:heat-inducible transcriptional repressor